MFRGFDPPGGQLKRWALADRMLIRPAVLKNMALSSSFSSACSGERPDKL